GGPTQRRPPSAWAAAWAGRAVRGGLSGAGGPPPPASPQIRATPFSTPSDGSLGVDGVLTRCCALPASSLTRKRSVKVPPTSTPSLYAIPLSFVATRRPARTCRHDRPDPRAACRAHPPATRRRRSAPRGRYRAPSLRRG